MIIESVYIFQLRKVHQSLNSSERFFNCSVMVAQGKKNNEDSGFIA